MSVLADLSEEERYLFAILQDHSGIDQAEFTWVDETSKDFVFRCYDYQYAWYRDRSKFQIDQCGRAVGKSVGMQMRAWAFPFTNPGEEMLLTAPEMIHLDPVTKLVEDRLLSIRMSREFLKKSGTSNGITHRPFEARFRNGSRIVGRIPQKDGKGVKGSISITANANPASPLTEDHTMILTPHGLTPAADLRVGDLVFTHRGRFRPIEHIYRYETDALEVAGAGHRGLLVSTNHRFWARRNTNPQRTRKLSAPTYVPVDDPELTQRWYWASPATFPAADLRIDDFPDATREGLDRTLVTTQITAEMLPVLFALAGRYLADGTMALRVDRPVQVSFVDDEKGIIEIEALAQLLGYHASRRRHDNAHCTTISSAGLCRWLFEQFGRLSDGKEIPGWLLGAPQELRQAVLDGYLAGDGHRNDDRGRWEFGTASKQLALGLKLLAQSLGFGTSFSWVDPKVSSVNGRDLKSAPKRSYRVQITDLDRNSAIFEDGFLWSKIRKVTPVGVREVVDFVVAEDFSYVGDGIVHKGSRFLPEDDEVI